MALWLNHYLGDGFTLEECQAGDRSYPVTLSKDAEETITLLTRMESFRVSAALGELSALIVDRPPPCEADHAVPASPSPPPSPRKLA
jgi:hypothetical protein